MFPNQNSLFSPALDLILRSEENDYRKWTLGTMKDSRHISMDFDKDDWTSRLELTIPWLIPFQFNDSYNGIFHKKYDVRYMSTVVHEDVQVYSDDKYQALALFMETDNFCIEFLMRHDGVIPKIDEFDKYWCKPPRSNVRIIIPKFQIMSRTRGQNNKIEFNEHGIGKGLPAIVAQSKFHNLIKIEMDELCFDRPFIFRIIYSDNTGSFTLMTGIFVGN